MQSSSCFAYLESNDMVGHVDGILFTLMRQVVYIAYLCVCSLHIDVLPIDDKTKCYKSCVWRRVNSLRNIPSGEGEELKRKDLSIARYNVIDRKVSLYLVIRKIN